MPTNRYTTVLFNVIIGAYKCWIATINGFHLTDRLRGANTSFIMTMRKKTATQRHRSST
uniref:Secreted protein n=1 Tax=Heterorhabditis bacteriophora TaxID=37862 RepID=A0A1I7XDL0_HETBA